MPVPTLCWVPAGPSLCWVRVVGGAGPAVLKRLNSSCGVLTRGKLFSSRARSTLGVQSCSSLGMEPGQSLETRCGGFGFLHPERVGWGDPADPQSTGALGWEGAAGLSPEPCSVGKRLPLSPSILPAEQRILLSHRDLHQSRSARIQQAE